MKPIDLVRFMQEQGHLKDTDRVAMAKYLMDVLDKPASLFGLKKYLDDLVEYEKS